MTLQTLCAHHPVLDRKYGSPMHTLRTCIIELKIKNKNERNK